MRDLVALEDPKMREANAQSGDDHTSGARRDDLRHPRPEAPRFEKEMKKAPRHRQWAMNHCLAEIGIHHREHRARAIAIGERLAVFIDYPASPGCTPPYAPVWIAEVVRRCEGQRGGGPRSKKAR
jgi:hypothetical protein